MISRKLIRQQQHNQQQHKQQNIKSFTVSFINFLPNEDHDFYSKNQIIDYTFLFSFLLIYNHFFNWRW